MLRTALSYAAGRLTAPAAACATLRDAPDSAAHDALLATLPEGAELRRRLDRAPQGDLPRAPRRRRPSAVDLIPTPYHGRPPRDLGGLFRGQAKGSTSHFHAYATAH